jgi:hypothetical protein
MGPAVLVTLGVLFLLANSSGYPFERTWPILLIVIGAIKVVRYVLPDSGHFNPGQYPPPYTGQYPPPYQPGVYAAGQQAALVAEPVVTPPPAPHAEAPGEGSRDQNEVRNG